MNHVPLPNAPDRGSGADLLPGKRPGDALSRWNDDGGADVPMLENTVRPASTCPDGGHDEPDPGDAGATA